LITLGFCINPITNLLLLNKSYKIYCKNNNVHDILDLKVDGLYVGDLITCSFIRFRELPQVIPKDIFIWYLIYKVMLIQHQTKSLLVKYRICFYITSYTSYVQHGVIARILIGAGVQTYSLASYRPILKRHIKGDYSHRIRYEEYVDQIYGNRNFHQLFDDAQFALEGRFKGVIDPMLSYMKTSSYANQSLEAHTGKYDGVLYLHDFFDSSFDLGYMLFDCIYSWAEHSFKLISDNKLNIAIKPHPNQSAASAEVVRLFKEQYPQLTWLDEKISNSQLFEGSLAGISMFGTVLYELAYFEKIAIGAGAHPALSFDLSYQPKTIAEYGELLISIKTLKPIVGAQYKAISFFAANANLCVPGDVLLGLDESKVTNWDDSAVLEIKGATI
jgi:hypothetical protein